MARKLTDVFRARGPSVAIPTRVPQGQAAPKPQVLDLQIVEEANRRDRLDLERFVGDAQAYLDALEQRLQQQIDALNTALSLLPSARWKGATTGGVGTIQELDNVNIASIVAGAGSLAVTFEEPFADADRYIVVAMATDGSEITWAIQAETATGFQLRGRDTAGATINWTTANRQFGFFVSGVRA